MTTGENRNKDRFKNWKLCVLWKFPFRHHRAIKLKQNCVWFTNPCLNIFVRNFVTRECAPRDLRTSPPSLQCISAHLLNTLPWASWEIRYFNLFTADFRSCLVARSRTPIKCVLKTLLRRCTHAVQIRSQKANGSSCSSQQLHAGRRIYTIYANHKDKGSPNFWDMIT